MTRKILLRRKAKENTTTANIGPGTFKIGQRVNSNKSSSSEKFNSSQALNQSKTPCLDLKRLLGMDDKMQPESKRARKQPTTNSPPISYGDERSVAGHFGWTSVELREKPVYLPFIYRSEKQLCPVRMLENALLQHSVHSDIDIKIIADCIEELVTICVQTDAECQLLNEINEMHCDGRFGAQPFTCNDIMIRLEDAEQLYEFINFGYNSLPDGHIPNVDKCGWIERGAKNAMAYTVVDGQRYIPTIYFDDREFDDYDYIDGWPLVYLKFALKLKGEHLLSPKDRRVYVIREDQLQMGRVLNSPILS